MLKHLRSRPQVLSLETHGKYYTNPFLPQMSEWLLANDYELWYKDGSDSVYIKRGLFAVSLADQLETRLAELAIRWKKFKRIFKAKPAAA